MSEANVLIREPKIFGRDITNMVVNAKQEFPKERNASKDFYTINDKSNQMLKP